MLRYFHCLIGTLIFFVSAQAQQLELTAIMKGNGFVGTSPENISWLIDNSRVYFQWNPNQQAGSSTYSYDLFGKKTEQIDQLKVNKNAPTIPHSDQNYAVHYYNDNGDLVRYSTKTKVKTIVYSGKEPIGNVMRVADPNRIYFEIGTAIYCYDANSGSIVQKANFTNDPPEINRVIDTSFLMKQQLELFPFLTYQEIKSIFHDPSETTRKVPHPIYYEPNERVQYTTISNNERFITFTLHQDSDDSPTTYSEFITKNGHTRTRNARPKVSDNDPEERMGIYDCMKDSVYFVSFSALTAIRKKPEYLKSYGDTTAHYTMDRKLAIHGAQMNENGRLAVVDIRSYDNKDRWIVSIELENGKVNELDHQHDEEWIGGPGISSWNDENGTLGWIDTTTCFYQSEVTGFSHLYTVNCKTMQKQALTSGNWEVYDAFLSRNHQEIYLIANKIHPGVRNGYVCHIASKQLVPLFEGNFGIEWSLSPDEKTWALRYSTSTTPWELYIAPNRQGSKMTKVTESRLPAYQSLTLQVPEIRSFPTSDGKQVYGRVYHPKTANGAAVFFVHGAGYLQNAHYFWSYYQREMLFHQLLAEKGYLVIDLDYRASEGYGKKWRTDIYRSMGERDLQDFIDVKNYAVKQLSIDSNRVGIYGGSYGGFITLMALLKTPDQFACGAALRAVTDWAHYNHEYTSNILNYPGTDPIAYQRSSPIYYANGLKSPLLLLHGMVDDNVQFQDIIRLNQRFIELGKTNYQLSVYPTESHSFTYTPAWVDEYRRILELFEHNL